MSGSDLSRETALRIGLAARALPSIDTGALVAMLVDAIGVPMTEEKLAGLSMKAFRQAGGEKLLAVPVDDLKAALKLLKGEGAPAVVDLPSPVPYSDGDMPASIRVACASNRGDDLDGHFGSCARFLVYQVSASEARLIDVRSTEAPEGTDDKNVWRTGLIADCQVLNVVSIGGPAAAKVVRANVHPIKHAEGRKAGDVVADLQKVLAGAPPPWLARVMGVPAETLQPFMAEAEQ